MIGYTGTAGLAVTIITIYYLLVYCPEDDPFRKKDDSIDPQQTVPYRPNPVDELFVRSLAKIRTRMVGKTGSITLRQRRLKDMLIKVHNILSS